MSIGDSLTLAVENLEKAIRAKSSGLPQIIIQVLYGHDCDQDPYKEILEKYNLDSLDVLNIAGTRIVICKMPWLLARDLKPRINDIDTSNVSKQDPDLTINDMEIMGIGEPATSNGAPTRGNSYKEGAQK